MGNNKTHRILGKFSIPKGLQLPITNTKRHRILHRRKAHETVSDQFVHVL